jgi:hypothetical protein
MPTNTGPVGSPFATLTRAALVVLGAVLTWSGGIWLLQLDRHAGPAAQRVNVRWVPDTANDPDKLARAEHEFRLTAGEAAGPRTWAYHLADRSSENIGRILASPSVEDTHWLDRGELRVQLNQPNIPGWVRELLNTEWASAVGLLLLVAGAVPVWFSRRQIVAAPGELRHLLRTARHAVRALTTAVTVPIRTTLVLPSAVTAPRPAVPRLQWKEVAAGLAMGLVLLAPLLAYGPSDDEEVGLGVFSSQVFYRALFAGHWNFWSNDLGFGTPMPIGQRLDFHPVFALGSLVSVWTALCAVWIVHVAVMVVYFLRLTTASGVRRPLRLILLAGYLFSIPSVFYMYQTDWVSVIVGWSLLPVLIFYLRRAALDPGHESMWMAGARLGLLGGFWFLNSHPGYLATLAFATAVYTLVLAPLRFRVYGSLLLAVVLAAGVSAERLWFSVSEMQWFPTTLDRATQGGYTVTQYVQAAITPLGSVPLSPRGPFVGLVLISAAVSVVLGLRRERDRHVRACGVAFAVAAAASMASQDMVEPLRAFSAVWMFRDPTVFFALLAAGVACQRALDTFRPAWRTVVWCCVAVQMAQQGMAAWPAYLSVAQTSRGLQHYRYQYQAAGIGGAIRAAGRVLWLAALCVGRGP